jgi:hypothetical protein
LSEIQFSQLACSKQQKKHMCEWVFDLNDTKLEFMNENNMKQNLDDEICETAYFPLEIY